MEGGGSQRASPFHTQVRDQGGYTMATRNRPPRPNAGQRRNVPSLVTTLQSQHGQNLVEFALLTPMVIAFIAAIVMFGLALNARASVQQAVREGARQAAVGATLGQVQTLSQGNAAEWIKQSTWVHWCH